MSCGRQERHRRLDSSRGWLLKRCLAEDNWKKKDGQVVFYSYFIKVRVCVCVLTLYLSYVGFKIISVGLYHLDIIG